jgi:hypothetical protein
LPSTHIRDIKNTTFRSFSLEYIFSDSANLEGLIHDYDLKKMFERNTILCLLKLRYFAACIHLYVYLCECA